MDTGSCSLVLTMFSMFLALSAARGPHHPRGAVVVKRHTHYTPGKKSEKITQDTRLLQDKEHIKEHLEDMAPTVDLSKMTEAEIELYYFLLHDTDKNSKLDGLELLNAILHTTHGSHGNYDQNEKSNMESSNLENDIDDEDDVSEENFSRFVELVDQVLKEDDKNKDGYLDYSEYVEGRARSEKVIENRPSIRIN